MVSVSSTLLATAIGTIGAYALARLRFLGRAFMASAVLITYLVPPSILFIPLYAQIRNLGMADSLTGLIADVPELHRALRDVAPHGLLRVDPGGAGGVGHDRRGDALRGLPARRAARWPPRASWRPPSTPSPRPGTSSSTPWSSSPTSSSAPCPVGLSTFITGDVYGWGYLMAGAVLTTLPVIAAYVYLQNYMVEGLTAGSVKG